MEERHKRPELGGWGGGVECASPHHTVLTKDN